MFTDSDVISTYTREQAIEDGQLVRADEAALAGWDIPVVITIGIAVDFEGDDLADLLRDMWRRVQKLRAADPDEYLFELPKDEHRGSRVWCAVEDGVATVMYPEER